MSAPPRLSRGVTITRRQITEEEVYYLVRDSRTGSFLRMGEVEAAVLRLLDGQRTLEQVAETLERSHGFHVGVPVIEAFVSTLIRKGLVESRVFDPAVFREEWERQQRSRRRTLGQALSSLTYLKVHLINPQRLLPVLARRLRFVWTAGFVIVTMALMATAAAMSVSYHREILESAFSLYRGAGASGGALVSTAALFYSVLFVVVAVHELAHGLTCAHFGGKVTDMGFILFYLQVPGFYCDITDAYSFEKRSHRLWTTFAGSYTGLLLAALGFFAWWTSETGDLLNSVGVVLMFVGGPPVLAFNWNPLLRLDGYYMLMDFLEAPNLMANSYAYLGHLVKSRVLRVPVEPMTVPHRLRRPYVIYGIGSLLFLAPWFLYMPLVAYSIFAGMFGTAVALPIAAGVAWRMVAGPVGKAATTLRYAWLSHRPALMGAEGGRTRAALMAGGGMVAVALLALGPRFAVRADSIGTLEPMENVEVRAVSAGFVPALAATSSSGPMPRPTVSLAGVPLEGDRVRRGDLLVRLDDPDLAAGMRAVALEREALRVERESLQARGDPAAAASCHLRETAAAAREAILLERLKGLELRSPIDGFVLTPRLEDRAGTYLRQGQPWCVIGRLDRLRVRVTLTERDLGVVGPGDEAAVRAAHMPGRTFGGRVVRMPAGRRPDRPGTEAARPPAMTAVMLPELGPQSAVSGSLDVSVEVDNAEGLLRPGLSVRVRIYGERLTLAGHAVRSARRLFKGKVWW